MSNEIKLSFTPAKTVYVFIINSTGQFWNTVTAAFEAYATANIGNYAVSLSALGTASSFYEGNFPTAITTGTYDIVAKQQLGGSVAESDPTIATEDGFGWGTASARVGFPDMATSGLLSLIAPVKVYRGEMVTNFPFKLVSSVDHVTPFTSGVVSGQVSQNGGAFGALQSGAFTEIGLGWYSLQALTSGDLLANTIALVFTAAGISGGLADQRDFSFILQRVSGST